MSPNLWPFVFILMFLSASNAAASDKIDIAFRGDALIAVDASPEAEGRCGQNERPFVATFQQESIAISRNKFPSEVATATTGEPAIITIRRGEDVVRERSQVLNSRFREVFQSSERETIPIADVAFEIRIFGCAFFGGLVVTDAVSELNGHAGFYELHHRMDVATASGDDDARISANHDPRFMRLHLNEDGERGGLNDDYGRPRREMGNISLEVSDQSHHFRSLDDTGGVDLELLIRATILLVDDGILGP